LAARDGYWRCISGGQIPAACIQKLGTAGGSDCLYRFNLTFFPQFILVTWDAAPLLAISPEFQVLNVLSPRFDHSGGRVPSSDDLFLVVDALRQTRRPEPGARLDWNG